MLTRVFAIIERGICGSVEPQQGGGVCGCLLGSGGCSRIDR